MLIYLGLSAFQIKPLNLRKIPVSDKTFLDICTLYTVYKTCYPSFILAAALKKTPHNR